jgi:hypothetical protein
VLTSAAIASACNVPVFRFALERWRADNYSLVVFHRGPLEAAAQEAIRPLEEQEALLTNVVVRRVDLDKLAAANDETASDVTAADKALYAALGSPAVPFLAVQYPPHLRIPVPVWAGPPSRESVAALADSPLRKELVRRLAEGQTAVWLLLESGDEAKDGPVRELVGAELKRLETSLELPELTDAPEDSLLAELPLKIAFSTLSVPRKSPQEQALVAMLVGSEPDLAGRSDPMVFPVFGRGRALLPLVGPGITAKNVEEAAAFLAGACSCEVKEQNPGFDLLLTADWDTLLSQDGAKLTALMTRHGEAPSEPVLVPIPTGSAASGEKSPAGAGHASSAAPALAKASVEAAAKTPRAGSGATAAILAAVVTTLLAAIGWSVAARR